MLAGNIAYIEQPGMSPVRQRLSRRYLTLLLRHDRYRSTHSTWPMASRVGIALDVVQARIASARDAAS